MNIQRAGSQPSAKGPGDWFTGTVRIDPLFNPAAPDRVQGAHVTFEPGARTASPQTAMTHIARQEVKDGKVVDWMGHVTDGQYGV